MWKIERWRKDVAAAVNDEELLKSYKTQSSRDLIIYVTAVIDVALAELLAMRLIDDAKEPTEFLGANEDGRAPAGSFGARMQLAYLAGLMPTRTLQGLRKLKALRNMMAHRVEVSLLSEKAQAQLGFFRDALTAVAEEVQDEGAAARLRKVVKESKTDEDVAKRVILIDFRAIHDGLHDLSKNMVRLEEL